VAQSLADAGSSVMLLDRQRASSAEDLVDDLRQRGAPEVRYVCSDLADAGQSREALRSATSDISVGILVNSAGVQLVRPLDEFTRPEWDRIIGINLSAAFDTMQLFLPTMSSEGFGRVFNIASVHGLVASPFKAPYVASKHALVGLTKAAALECATAGDARSGGVTVNVICPGWVESPLIEAQVEAIRESSGLERTDALEQLVREKQPTGRLTTPTEIGAMIVNLSSPVFHNVTGAQIVMDGGWTIQ
jgi:3-hydroxybutyrate dehydrogenase